MVSRLFQGMKRAGSAVGRTASARYTAQRVAGHDVVGSMWGAVTGSAHAKNALIGAGIGAGISGAYGASTGQGFVASAERGAVAGAGIGAAGTFINRSIKAMPKKRTLNNTRAWAKPKTKVSTPSSAQSSTQAAVRNANRSSTAVATRSVGLGFSGSRFMQPRGGVVRYRSQLALPPGSSSGTVNPRRSRLEPAMRNLVNDRSASPTERAFATNFLNQRS